jgi:hypothetical protein
MWARAGINRIKGKPVISDAKLPLNTMQLINLTDGINPGSDERSLGSYFDTFLRPSFLLPVARLQ